MMKIALTTIAILALIAPVRADEFHLTDATGKKYGPFYFKQGEKLSIAGQVYTISKVLTKEDVIIEKMKSIMIPEINFRQANVQDVISYLQAASVEYDAKSERMRGVNAILNLGPPSAAPMGTPDPFEADAFDAFTAAPLEEHDQGTGVPLITLEARNISFYDVINIICKMCDLGWSIQNSVVMIELKKKETKNEGVQQTPARDSVKAADGLHGTREE